MRDKPTQVTDALNNTIQLNYDPLSRVTEVQEPLQRTTQFQYDALNRLIKSIDALQGESVQGFDADGNRDNFQDPNQHTTEFQYDASGRVLSETTTGGGTKTYTWNTLNQLIQLRNGRSQDRQFNYDALGRLTSISDTDGTLTYTFDANGNLLNVHNSQDNSTIQREYDTLNRVTRYTDSQGNVLQYGYDEVANLTQLSYPDGKQVFYTYDANNRLAEVKDWANRMTGYSYDANGRLIETQTPNGTVQTRRYDAKGQLLQLKDVDALGNVIVQYDFTFDAGGDITQEISIPTPNAFAMANAEMAYTEYNRLLEVNGLNPTFDLDGNMSQGLLGGGLETFNFDSRNRLSQAGNTSYLYDAENQRIGITENGQTSRFVVNSVPALSQVLVRTKPDGTQTYYVYGLGLIGEETNGNYRTYHYDLRGSTVALTDTSGVVTQRFQYSAYGLLVVPALSEVEGSDASQTPFLFNGAYGVMTDSNGLYYMRARFYNPEIRRFVNQDVLLGRVSDGQSLNRFAFVTGNPVSFVDPFGFAPILHGSDSDQRIMQNILDKIKNSGKKGMEFYNSLNCHFYFSNRVTINLPDGGLFGFSVASRGGGITASSRVSQSGNIEVYIDPNFNFSSIKYHSNSTGKSQTSTLEDTFIHECGHCFLYYTNDVSHSILDGMNIHEYLKAERAARDVTNPIRTDMGLPTDDFSLSD